MLQPLEFFARAHFDFWRPLCRRKGFLELVYNFSELINETTPLSWQGGRFFLTTLEKNQHFSKMYEMAESYVERFRGYYYKSFDKGIYKKYHSLWKYFGSNMMQFWNVRVLGARARSEKKLRAARDARAFCQRRASCPYPIQVFESLVWCAEPHKKFFGPLNDEQLGA